MYALGWVVSDSIKAFLAVCEIAYGIKQLSDLNGNKNMRRIRWLATINAVFILAVSIGSHSPGRVGWRASTILLSIIVGNLIILLLYVSEVVSTALFSVKKMTVEAPHIAPRVINFGAAVVVIAICTGLIGSLVTGDSYWGSIKHVAGAVATICGGSYYIYSLGMLRSVMKPDKGKAQPIETFKSSKRMPTMNQSFPRGRARTRGSRKGSQPVIRSAASVSVSRMRYESKLVSKVVPMEAKLNSNSLLDANKLRSASTMPDDQPTSDRYRQSTSTMAEQEHHKNRSVSSLVGFTMPSRRDSGNPMLAGGYVFRAQVSDSNVASKISANDLGRKIQRELNLAPSKEELVSNLSEAAKARAAEIERRLRRESLKAEIKARRESERRESKLRKETDMAVGEPSVKNDDQVKTNDEHVEISAFFSRASRLASESALNTEGTSGNRGLPKLDISDEKANESFVVPAYHTPTKLDPENIKFKTDFEKRWGKRLTHDLRKLRHKKSLRAKMKILIIFGMLLAAIVVGAFTFSAVIAATARESISEQYDREDKEYRGDVDVGWYVVLLANVYFLLYARSRRWNRPTNTSAMSSVARSNVNVGGQHMRTRSAGPRMTIIPKRSRSQPPSAKHKRFFSASTGVRKLSAIPRSPGPKSVVETSKCT